MASIERYFINFGYTNTITKSYYRRGVRYLGLEFIFSLKTKEIVCKFKINGVNVNNMYRIAQLNGLDIFEYNNILFMYPIYNPIPDR